MEKLLDQQERIVQAKYEYAAVLAQVKDNASSKRLAPQLKNAALSLAHELEAMQPIYEAGAKTKNEEVVVTPQDGPRQKQIESRRPQVRERSKDATAQLEAQIHRVETQHGLSREMWNVLKVEDVRQIVLSNELQKYTGNAIPPENEQHIRSVLALYEKYGPAKSLDMQLRGYDTTEDFEKIKRSLQKALGSDIEVLGGTRKSFAALQLTLAPVESIDQIIEALHITKIVGRDDGRMYLVAETRDNVAQRKDSNSLNSATGSQLVQAGPQRSDNQEIASPPANSNLQREYARLAQLLNSDDTFGKKEAAESLLKVRPSDVANADTRKLIARGYRSLAEDSKGFHDDTSIRGLVLWGGKYSVPILITLLDKDKFGSEAVLEALGELKDPQGAEAASRKLGNFMAHENAVNALRKMGSVAEDALIKTAPSSNPDASLAAVQLLGEVGSEKSNAVLQQATNAHNPQVKMAAREALRRIRDRKKTGELVDKPNKAADPNSPFAEGSGPPVDLTARNTRESTNMEPRNLPGLRNSPLKDEATEEPANLDEGDWSKVNALLPGGPAGKGVPADPVKNETDGWKPQPVRLGNMTSPHERPVALSVSSGGTPQAIVIFEDPFNKSFARLETINLRQRKSLGSSNGVGGVTQCYLSPSGTRMLFVAEEGFHNRKARLDVWNLNGGKPVEEVTWWPFATSKGMFGPNEITWADWLDDDQLLIVNGEGTTVLWRIEGRIAHAIYQIDANGRCTPSLSPGRAHMALATPRGVEIYRATNGELLARMDSVRPGAGQVAFNLDGSKLACVSGRSVYVWNATTGKLERDFDCADLRNGDLAWLDDTHLLAGGTDIIDIQRRIVLWRYEMPSLPANSRGTTRWLLMQINNVLGLAPVQLLQPEVLAAANELDPESILALKPGAKVSLDVQIGGDEQQKAEAALRNAVEQNGMTIVPDSPFKIAARIVTGQSETKEYGSGFFFRENLEQVTVTNKHFEVELLVDGQSAWKQISTIQAGSPHMIWLKDGETAQQAIDRQNAARSANFSFSASLPRYVVHPKYAGPHGTSKISLAGGR